MKYSKPEVCYFCIDLCVESIFGNMRWDFISIGIPPFLRYFYHVLQSNVRSHRGDFARSFLISARKLNPDKVLYDVCYHPVEEQFKGWKDIWFFHLYEPILTYWSWFPAVVFRRSENALPKTYLNCC